MKVFNFVSALANSVRRLSGFFTPTAAGHTADPYAVLGNPLRGLNPARAAAMMEAAVRGEWTQIQWLMWHAEQRDPDLLALITHRTSAIREMTWNVKISEKAQALGLQELAERQRNALVAEYEKIENLYEAIEHLILATFRGFAHVAKNGSRLEPLDQWWWVRNGLYGSWFWNPDARQTSARAFSAQDAVDENDYIIRVEQRPVLYWAIMKFLYSLYGMRWWSAFCEIISKQGMVIVGPENMNASQAALFRTAAANIASGAGGSLPFGSNVVYPNANRGTIPYDAWMRWLSEKLVLAGTGGKLTMLNDATGIGGGQSDTHADTFAQIARSEARTISEIFQMQFDKPILHAAFPDAPILVYWELAANEEVDVGKIVDNVLKLSQAGYQVDAAQVTEQTGYRLTLKPQPAAPAFGAFGNRCTLANRAPVDKIADELGVDPDWIAPVADLLAPLAAGEQLTAEQAAVMLEQFALRLPELFGQMDAQEFADLLERGMGQAVIEGVRDALKQR
jgi:phage gp29-like protein